MIKIYLFNENTKGTEEICINIEIKQGFNLKSNDKEIILNLVTEMKNNEIHYSDTSNIINAYEVGPRFAFCTPWCSNALEILKNSNINYVERIERSYRFKEEKDADDFIDIMTQTYYKSIETFSENKTVNDSINLPIQNLNYYNKKLGLSFDQQDINYYKTLFKKKITNVELFDLAQSNSEHSRHWIFNGNYIIKNKVNFIDTTSMFKRIKSTNNLENNNSLNAFSDNASAIEGYDVKTINSINVENRYRENILNLCPTHTAETHNFPTGVCPFPGAATGTGGRIRDTIAIGRGGEKVSSYVGYSVGNIESDNDLDYPYENPKNILIKASNGASDYGNKIGEPVTLGYTRSFYMKKNYKRIEYVKPIMYCGGIGSIIKSNIEKNPPALGMLIVRVGGPAYSIGLGGGSASSRNQDKKNKELDFNAVQRGDPQMENKVCRFIKFCSELEYNPIVSIHDQGSGGMGNVTKEIVEPNGAFISLNNVKLGDKYLESNEIWNAEYQEQVSILINPLDIKLVKEIAKRECVNIEFVGIVNNSGRIEVFNKNDKLYKVLDFNLDEVLNNIPTKQYSFNVPDTPENFPLKCDPNKINDYLVSVLNSVNVGSKRFLTNKVDRSVTGLIAQQQCVGPFHTPLSNFSITAFSMQDTKGTVASIGEQPIKGLVDNKSLVDMTIGEMLTNLIFALVSDFKDIKCLGNWMWSPKLLDEGYKLYEAVKQVEEIMKVLKIGIDGGKDSLSMNTVINADVVMSPNTLVMSCYVLSPDITCKVTPNFKDINSNILFIDLSYNNYNLGGSILSQILDNLGCDTPKFRKLDNFVKIFNYIQCLLKEKKILSGHDRSDGGLITTLIEMSLSSYVGCEINIKSDIDYISYLFNEELGLIIEVEDKYTKEILDNINTYCPTYLIGKTTSNRDIKVTYNNKVIINDTVVNYWKEWEKTSYNLEKEQCAINCVESEYESIESRIEPYSFIDNDLISILNTESNLNSKIFNIGVIREVGSNGDREMSAAFWEAGFNVFDITMNDLIEDYDLINSFNFRGLAFVGGFSYSDVFGAGVGWASNILNNNKVRNQFEIFFKKENTFSLGVCNGCQLMSLLGIIPKVRFIKNDSKRFESRWVSLKISDSNCIFTKNMNQTTFGMWSAHGEGKIVIDDFEKYKDNYVLNYVDDCGNITTKYPFNPNGSINGIAGISSNNGRHFALMPHPERCFLKWQCPYIKKQLNRELTKYTPWFMLFKNAYNYCLNN